MYGTTRTGSTWTASLDLTPLINLLSPLLEPFEKRKSRQLLSSLEAYARLYPLAENLPTDVQQTIFKSLFTYRPTALESAFYPSRRDVPLLPTPTRQISLAPHYERPQYEPGPYVMRTPTVEERTAELQQRYPHRLPREVRELAEVESAYGQVPQRLLPAPDWRAVGKVEAEPQRLTIPSPFPPRIPGTQTIEALRSLADSLNITDPTQRQQFIVKMLTGEQLPLTPQQEAELVRQKAEALADAFSLSGDRRTDFIERFAGIVEEGELSKRETSALNQFFTLRRLYPNEPISQTLSRMPEGVGKLTQKVLDKIVRITDIEEKEALARRKQEFGEKMAEGRLSLEREKVELMRQKLADAHRAAQQKDFKKVWDIVMSAYKAYKDIETKRNNLLFREYLEEKKMAPGQYIPPPSLHVKSIDEWLRTEGFEFLPLIEPMTQTRPPSPPSVPQTDVEKRLSEKYGFSPRR